MKFFIILILIVCSFYSIKTVTSNILDSTSNSNINTANLYTTSNMNMVDENIYFTSELIYTKDVSKLEVSIQEVTPTSLTINAIDNNWETFYFNDIFTIAKLENDDYKVLERLIPLSNYDSECLPLKRSSISIVEFDWEKIYGELSSGQYKLDWILDNRTHYEIYFIIE